MRRLHPRVRHDDPERGKVRAKDDEKRRQQPHARTEPVAAKEQQAEEAAFEEKGKDAFGGEQTAKDVADKPRIARPVRAKFKFLHDAGGDAHRKHQPVHLDPEEGRLPPHRVFGADILNAHHNHQQTQAHRDGRVDEMKTDREGKLKAGNKFGIHSHPLPCRCRCSGSSFGRIDGNPRSALARKTCPAPVQHGLGATVSTAQEPKVNKAPCRTAPFCLSSSCPPGICATAAPRPIAAMLPLSK